MKRNRTTVDFRNKLAELAMGMDSSAFVNSATEQEREYIQDELRSLVNYIDNKI